MGYLADILISIPIGVLYDLIVQKVTDISIVNVPYEEKVQKSLIFIFIGSIVGYVLAMSVFDYRSTFENRAVKYGLFFGSTLLIMNSIIFNWSALSDDLRLIIMTFVFACTIALSYRYITTSDKKQRKRSKNGRRNRSKIID